MTFDQFNADSHSVANPQNTLEETPFRLRATQISQLTADDCELIPMPEKIQPTPHLSASQTQHCRTLAPRLTGKEYLSAQQRDGPLRQIGIKKQKLRTSVLGSQAGSSVHSGQRQACKTPTPILNRTTKTKLGQKKGATRSQ